jgi:putative ABC transport system permease protein
MKFTDIIRIAFSTFTNNRMRTLLTVTGVAIGISAIVFLVSIGNGLQQITIGDIQSIKALTCYDVTSGNSEILSLDNTTVSKLKNIKNVVSVNPMLSMSGQIGLGDKTTDVLVNDASAEYIDLQSPIMTTGDLYHNDNDDGIIATQVVANAFNIKPADLMSKTVKLTFYIPNLQNPKLPTFVSKDYKVVGVINDTSASFAYIPPGTVTIPDGINFTQVKVKVDTSKNMTTVKNELTNMGYKTASVGEKIDQISRIFKIVQLVLLVFGAVALIVASIGMFNTLTISLLERTRDIGIMKALGARDRSIYAIFLTESTVIAFVGGIFGVILAMLIGLLANIAVAMLATKAGGQTEAIFQPPMLFVTIIFVFSILVGVLTGLYPSKRAAKINPLDALRYE